MNGYICYCFVTRKDIEIYAENLFAAKEMAVIEFRNGSRKKIKSSDVTCQLAEKNGETVIHTPDF